MKKFYALAAAAAVCLSASAFNFKDAANLKSVEGAPLFQLENYKPVEKTLNGVDRQAARAGEFNIADMDVYVYLDYFTNYSEGEPVYEDEYLTCEPSDFTVKADGTITINNWNGYIFAPEMWYDKYEGTLEMEMGQVLVASGTYEYRLCGITNDVVLDEGIVYLDVYPNAVAFPGALGVQVFDTAENDYIGWLFISEPAMWVKSNAEVTYKWTTDGATLNDLTQRCYTEYSEKNSAVYVSGLTRTGESNLVPFTIENGEGLAYEKIALFSMSAGQGKETGDFKLVTFGDDDTYAPYVTSVVGEDLKTMTFDGIWGVYSEEGYWMGMCTPATYTFDYELPESFAPAGVESVAVDANAPVEYFNLQGVRVNAPEAGQLLIKRQGAQVSKVIVR